MYDGFDYVALGHLHRPQRCGSDTVRYAGSLLKYSFAEHDQVKSVSVVEIGAAGSADGDAGAAGRARVTVETVALTPRRDVRRLEGTLAALLEGGAADPRRDDYVLAVSARPRSAARPHRPAAPAYPNALSIERPAVRDERPRPARAGRAPAASATSNCSAPSSSYATGEGLDDSAARRSCAIIDGLERRRREALG